MIPGNSQIDLERKAEIAFAARLRQHPLLAKLRMRRTTEDSPRVNQDLVIAAKRGDGNPPYSGIYNMEVSCTLTMKHRKSIDTLAQFLRLLAAMEEVFNVTQFEYPGGVPVQLIALQLSSCAADFHCYEVAVSGKDDTPEDNKHKCVWSLSIIAMSQSYANAVKLQT